MVFRARLCHYRKSHLNVVHVSMRSVNYLMDKGVIGK